MMGPRSWQRDLVPAASGGDDAEPPITGQALATASQAALEESFTVVSTAADTTEAGYPTDPGPR